MTRGFIMVVYPRVCGGTGAAAAAADDEAGLSPRVRGNRTEKARVKKNGVYPRVCGGTDQQRRHANQRGSIPACAGEPR